jgi:acyl dehydratase
MSQTSDPEASATGFENVKALAGADIQPSPWLDVTQDMVDDFARATGDRQWIHVDAKRAKDGPYGATVAHGFLTLSLIPLLWRRTVRIEGIRSAVNYGLDRVRFPAPLTIPSRVRARFSVAEVRVVRDVARSVVHVTVERQGGEKPVCVAELLLVHHLTGEPA